MKLKNSLGRLALFGIAMVVMLSLGCASKGVENDPILRLSAVESLEQGKQLMEQGKYTQATKYLSHAFEIEPNSATGREALLLVADAHFAHGGPDNMIQAEAKYRDFLNRFPTSDRAAYVQFQIGNALAARLERPDRDQKPTLDALDAYRELLRIYPTTEYREEAQLRIDELLSLLAEHEFSVAYFYYRYGLPGAAVGRLERMLENYPTYQDKDKAYYYLGLANRKGGRAEEATQWFQRLKDEFPESGYVHDVPSGV
ncbi:MAG: outer membrane protein assembly factor BamD [Thermoanaerobaculia bacterium]|nr:outer membrane protein assembly factor BamD [Thermoanaerobaculia bacterium]